MGKEKFTPGPWKIVVEHTKHRHIAKIYHRREVDVGNGTEIAVVDIDNPATVELDVANAHLIAAAQEMYELLDCIRKSVALDAGIMAGCIARVEPLLKKARGEE